MKYIMITIFTVCMGGFFYLFNSLMITHNIPDSDAEKTWILAWMLVVFGVSAIAYSAFLGWKEDKAKAEKHKKEMELLQKRIDNCF